jgi:hypothetical protein
MAKGVIWCRDTDKAKNATRIANGSGGCPSSTQTRGWSACSLLATSLTQPPEGPLTEMLPAGLTVF